jgi:glycosyltransferase involved in cell wall biosynthesis
MEFSVIVPALNEEFYIEACMKSISRQTLPRNSYEIIVSDGGSNDRTVEIAKKYADRVVVSKKRGIWWGRNQGVKFARGKYLVFIDADTRIKEDYLETVQRYLENGVVGLSTAFEIEGIGLKTKILEYIVCCYLWLNSEIYNANLIGINLCVPRDKFTNVGGFRDYALEDAAFGRELRKEGQTCFLIQRKVVTSARRLEAYGVVGLCRYYVELGLIDSGKINRSYINKCIKYKEYIPIRTFGRKKGSYKCENNKALSRHIRGATKKVLKWTQQLT